MINHRILLLAVVLLLVIDTAIQSDEMAVSPTKETQSVKKQLTEQNETFHNRIPQEEDDFAKLPDSFRYFFYFVIAISVIAILVIIIKLFRLVVLCLSKHIQTAFCLQIEKITGGKEVWCSWEQRSSRVNTASTRNGRG